MILSTQGYSATVRLLLRVGDVQLPVAQVGPNSLILREACGMALPGGEADIEITIDGRTETHPIVLTQPAAAGTTRVEFF